MKHGTEEYDRKLFTIALSERVIKDGAIEIIYDRHKRKLRAIYSPEDIQLKGFYFVQFPNNLRILGKKYICDLIERNSDDKGMFYSVIKESIREL